MATVSLVGTNGRKGVAAACALLVAVLLATALTGTAAAAGEEYPTNVVDRVIFGGSAMDQVTTSATDAQGNVYVVGWTVSPDFPQKGGLGIPFKPDNVPWWEAFYTQGFATKFGLSLIHI